MEGQEVEEMHLLQLVLKREWLSLFPTLFVCFLSLVVPAILLPVLESVCAGSEGFKANQRALGGKEMVLRHDACLTWVASDFLMSKALRGLSPLLSDGNNASCHLSICNAWSRALGTTL